MLGVVGRGYWGKTYCKTLREMGVPHWQDGRYWHMRQADGLIIACCNAAHYEVAKCALGRGIPVLVEKPIAMTSVEAWDLVRMGGIGLAAHTRLYADDWRRFRGTNPEDVEASAGGVTESSPDHHWNWMTHFAAMCFDAGIDPARARISITKERSPLRFVADGKEFVDGPALRNLCGAFLLAIENGVPDNRGLELGARVVEFTEKTWQSAPTTSS